MRLPPSRCERRRGFALARVPRRLAGYPARDTVEPNPPAALTSSDEASAAFELRPALRGRPFFSYATAKFSPYFCPTGGARENEFVPGHVRGAKPSPPQLRGRGLLTAALLLFPPVSPTFRRSLRVAGSLWLEERFRGDTRSTPGLRSNPAFLLANSLVSPVDRKRLLTAPSNTLPQFDKVAKEIVDAGHSGVLNIVGWQPGSSVLPGEVLTPLGKLCAVGSYLAWREPESSRSWFIPVFLKHRYRPRRYGALLSGMPTSQIWYSLSFRIDVWHEAVRVSITIDCHDHRALYPLGQGVHTPSEGTPGESIG